MRGARFSWVIPQKLVPTSKASATKLFLINLALPPGRSYLNPTLASPSPHSALLTSCFHPLGPNHAPLVPPASPPSARSSSIQICILRTVQDNKARRQEATDGLINIHTDALSPDYVGPPPLYSTTSGGGDSVLKRKKGRYAEYSIVTR